MTIGFFSNTIDIVIDIDTWHLQTGTCEQHDELCEASGHK
jgi:hypothetical protein